MLSDVNNPKTIILRIPLGPPELFKEDWEKIIEYYQTLGNDFKLALKHPRHGIIAKDNGIPFFFEYPVNSVFCLLLIFSDLFYIR